MRKLFEVQYEIGVTPIEKVPLPERSRDEIPAVLRALQYIYKTPELNEKVFAVLKRRILDTKAKTGREGMDLWAALVLGVARNARGTNYDHLHYIANYDWLTRSIMGVETAWGYDKKQFSFQTIKDNVALIDEALIQEINQIVIDSGHEVKGLKKKDLSVKVDSYVVESNVHFPTDYNLLWDAARKCCDMIKQIGEAEEFVSGWRKLKRWRRKLKSAYIAMCRASSSGGKNKEERIYRATVKYTTLARDFSKKIKNTQESILGCVGRHDKTLQWVSLQYFVEMLDKHIDLLERRVFKKEKIPHEEKMFSLFETYTEWISKGKSGNRVELGVNVAIATDEAGFVLTHEVMNDGKRDAVIVVEFAEKLLNRYAIGSISFDKGFWSKDNYDALKTKVSELIMPKKGKYTQAEKEREGAKNFQRLRRKHSAIESDINALEHHGLNRCPDKGLKQFKRYVAMSILAMNLHRLGNALVQKQRSRIPLARAG